MMYVSDGMINEVFCDSKKRTFCFYKEFGEGRRYVSGDK